MQSSRWATKSEDELVQKSTPAPTKELDAPAAQDRKIEPSPIESSTIPPTDISYDYGYGDPSIDPFAQTAGTDDLFFDDDIVPIPEPVIEQNPIDTQPPPESTEPRPSSGGLAQSQHTPRGPANGDRGGRGRGRGRGGRGRGRGNAPPTETRELREKKDVQPKKEEPKDSETSTPAPATTTTTTTSETENPEASTDPPSTSSVAKDAAKDATKAPISVRGDRTLTGGPKRSRLTEDELNAKLASMRSKNETLVAAHARAEADASAFSAREAAAAKQSAITKKQAAERQKVERRDRQQMMGERERNRQRKLDALKGREWDVEKEGGFEGTGEERRRGAARGAYGGVAPSPRPADNEWANTGEEVAADDAPSTPSHRGRGRGGRGARGGRGGRGGRGDHQTTGPRNKKEEQALPSASDFPDLPPAPIAPKESEAQAPKKLDFPIKTKTSEVKASDEPRPGVKKQESFGLPSPMGAGKSWADQVEGS